MIEGSTADDRAGVGDRDQRQHAVRLVQPTPGQYKFTVPDRVAEFVLGSGLRMRGHAFCWYLAPISYKVKLKDPHSYQANSSWSAPETGFDE